MIVISIYRWNENIMNKREFKKIKRGNILTNKSSGNSYVVDDELDSKTYIGIRTIIITNPSEWVKFRKD